MEENKKERGSKIELETRQEVEDKMIFALGL